MATIESRLTALERASIQSKPIPILVLPEQCNPQRASIQAEIEALEKAGIKIIVIVRPSYPYEI